MKVVRSAAVLLALWIVFGCTVFPASSNQRQFSFSTEEQKAVERRLTTPPPKPYPFPKASSEEVGGIHTLVVNGVPVTGMARSVWTTTLEGAPVERQLRQSGVKLFIIDVGLTADMDGERPLSTAPDAAFRQFETRAKKVLESVPDAVLMIRLWLLNVDRDYIEAHPEAVLMGENGNVDWDGRAYPGGKVGHSQRPNMLVDWKLYCGEHLHRFVHRIGQSEFASQVAGFYLGAMNSGEWWYYKGLGDPGWDYSTTRQRAFEKYVRFKYGDDSQRIADAWGVVNTPDILRLPTLKERGEQPVRPHTPAADYLEVLNLPVTEAAVFFGKIIKSATAGKGLVGIEAPMGGITYPNNGTIFFREMMEAKEIDFFGGPSYYNGRRAGSVPLVRVLHSSLKKNGKFWFNEGDYRTHLVFGSAAAAAGEPPQNPWESKQVLLREHVRGLVFGYPTYLMDFGWNWFYSPSIVKVIQTTSVVEEAVREAGVRRRAEVAVVTDQESQLYGNYFANPAERMFKGKLDQLGVSWDSYELSDFLSLKENRYKLVVFLNICALNDEERLQLKALRGPGRTFVWMHRPGETDLSRRRTADPVEMISDLTGFKLLEKAPVGEVTADPKVLRQLFEGETRFLPMGSQQPKVTELNREVSLSDAYAGMPIGNVPAPYQVSDSDAICIARDRQGRTYVALKEINGWTSIYTAFCDIDPVLLRAIARRAGCHLWVESEDFSFIAENLIGLHASTSGRKEVALPEKRDVFDLVAGQIVAEQVSRFTIPMMTGETRIFQLGRAEALKKNFDIAHAALKSDVETLRQNAPKGKVSDVRLKEYAPQLSTETEQRGLAERFHPPIIAISGPFHDGTDALKALDDHLRSLEAVRIDSSDVSLLDRLGRSADQFLYVVNPQSKADLRDGLKHWQVFKTRPWMEQHHVGMSRGQVYAGFGTLRAETPTKVRFYFATEGEGKLWIDGELFTPDLRGVVEKVVELNRIPLRIAFRVKGSGVVSGFTLKLAESVRSNDLLVPLKEPAITTVIPIVEK